MTSELPIDRHLGEIGTMLKAARRLVVVAPPGAGKTTRVPLALARVFPKGQIVLLEPRRIAARNAAKMMAQASDGNIGGHVGYVMRDERRRSADTRVLVMTEGVLTRRLLDDALLEGVACVVIDEFHERSVHADFALCLCKELLSVRDDFHLVVMSATLDADAVATYLDDAPVVRAEVPPFPLTVEYKRPRTGERMEDSASSAILGALSDPRTEGGDVLCFLPGRGEIARTADRLAEKAPRLDVRPLYGALDDATQKAIFSTDAKAPRRCILATNIAESSVTVPRVRAVVDAGFERRIIFNDKTLTERLVLRRISGQSADQRAGRAARLGPGLCVRLWGEKEHALRRAQLEPEVTRSDPLALVLQSLNYQSGDPMALDWLTSPGQARVRVALATLRRLGVVEPDSFALTAMGRTLGRHPLSVRAGVFLHHAEAVGVPDAALFAVLLDEPDVAPKIDARRCDLSARRDAVVRGARGGATLLRRADRIKVRAPKAPPPDALEQALLLAFTDQVGEVRDVAERRATVARGTGLTLGRAPPRPDDRYFVTTRLFETERGGVVAEWVTFVDKAQVETVLASRLVEAPVLRLEGDKGRLVSGHETRLGALTLRRTDTPLSPAERDDAFYHLALDERSRWFKLDDDASALWARVQYAAARLAEAGDAPAILARGDVSADDASFDDAVLLRWARDEIVARKSIDALSRLPFARVINAHMPGDVRAALRSRFPERFEVPSGESIRLDYTDCAHGAPILPVKIQEMFGCQDTPRIDEGRVALRLHLLAPNRRPAQVTSDIAGFWARTYPEVKKELKQRYPKHPWPDDPLSAPPTKRTKRAFAAHAAGVPPPARKRKKR